MKFGACSHTSRARSGARSEAPLGKADRVGRRFGCLAAGGLLALGAVGCGGSSDEGSNANDGVASVEDVEVDGDVAVDGEVDGEDTATATTFPAEEQERAASEAAWEACMAEQGIELPDFEQSTGNDVDGDVEDAGTTDSFELDYDPEELAAANAACRDVAPTFDPTEGMDPAQEAAFDDYLLEMEQCLRDQGIDSFPITGTPEEQEAAVEELLTMGPEEMDRFEAAGQLCEEQVAVPSELESLPGYGDDEGSP